MVRRAVDNNSTHMADSEREAQEEQPGYANKAMKDVKDSRFRRFAQKYYPSDLEKVGSSCVSIASNVCVSIAWQIVDQVSSGGNHRDRGTWHQGPERHLLRLG